MSDNQQPAGFPSGISTPSITNINGITFNSGSAFIEVRGKQLPLGASANGSTPFSVVLGFGKTINTLYYLKVVVGGVESYSQIAVSADLPAAKTNSVNQVDVLSYATDDKNIINLIDVGVFWGGGELCIRANFKLNTGDTNATIDLVAIGTKPPIQLVPYVTATWPNKANYNYIDSRDLMLSIPTRTLGTGAVNLDNYVVPCIISTNDLTPGCKPAGTSGQGNCLVFATDGAMVSQLFITTDTGSGFIRYSSTSGTNWSPWNPMGAPVSSVAGKVGAVTLVKADVGLANVDNTSDANKPVSTAMAAALLLKSDTTHTHTLPIANITGLQASLDSKMTGSATLPDSVDLNTVVTSGFYRINATPVNGPTPTVAFGQLIVSRGSDTVAQIAINYSTQATYIRSGNPTQAGGAGTWGAWTQVLTAAVLNPTTGAGASGTWGISVTGSAAFLGGVAAASYTQTGGTVSFADVTASSGWFRTAAATGWYNNTYGGGINMQDTTYVRTYGSKQFYCDSTITAGGNVVAYSDKRLKENFKEIPDALGICRALKGYTFNWNNHPINVTCKKEGQEDIGLIAQDVELVIPWVVKESLTGVNGDETVYKVVDYSRCVPILLQAINQLATKVEALESRSK